MGAPRLTDTDIQEAVKLLDGWTQKLTWDRYLAVLETVVGHRYSKVAMHKQPRIIGAWEGARKRLAAAAKDVGARGYGDAAIAELHRQKVKLKAENQRLEQENLDLLERFRRWAHNAHRHGMSAEQLDAPISIGAPEGRSR